MASGTLPVVVVFRQRALDHLALPRIAQLGTGLLEWHPAHVVDLVVMIGGVPGEVLEEVEGHRLEDPDPPAAVPVLDVAEALDDPRVDPRLLPHLARGGGLLALARVRPALGERAHAGAPGRGDHEHLAVADHHPAVGPLALNRHSRAGPPGRARSGARAPA